MTSRFGIAAQHRPIAAALGVVAMCLASVTLSRGTTHAHADTVGCADVELAFTRGTNQPPGVGATGEAFVGALRDRLGNKTLNVYAVQYPATFDAGSAKTGAADLAAHVDQVGRRCPQSQIVLGGYSQGALVTYGVSAAPVDLSVPTPGSDDSYAYRAVPSAQAQSIFATPIPPQDRGRVDAIVLFGNPAHRSYQGNPILLEGFPDGIVFDQCTGADPICQVVPNADIGQDLPNHLGYPHTDMPAKAADFVTSKLR